MGQKIIIPGRSLLGGMKNLVFRDRVKGVDLQPMRARGPLGVGGTGSSERITAIITIVNGSGSGVSYDATGEFRTSISVTNQVPVARKFNPAVVLIQAAPQFSRCTLAKKKDAQGVAQWVIEDAWEEIWTTEACDSGGAAGLGTSGIMTVAEHSRDDRQLSYGSLTAQTASVTALASTRFGFKIYDFPAGYILLENLILSLRASAPTNVNTLRFALGTAQATGNGTTLTSTLADIYPQTDLGVLTSGGVDFSGHSTTPPAGFNGTATPVDLWLNFCPSANWTTSEDITIAQPPTAARSMSMMWRNGGLLP